MPPQHNHCEHAEQAEKSHPDYLLWGSFVSILILYVLYWQFDHYATVATQVETLSRSVFELINTIWWGIVIGMLMVAILSKVPREFVIAILGTGKGVSGVLRATAGGVLLDLCSHGILMVGAKLYERGASAGQVMAFLVASPWNSFSLTLILIALIGLMWTLFFILASMLIAVVTGIIFERLVKLNVLPENPNQANLPEGFKFWPQARSQFQAASFNLQFLREMLKNGVMESRMVLRWILFGVLLAGLIRAFIDVDTFQAFFGPTLAGLGLTILAATIIEVCSEGSTPVAADLLTRANAPGNSFAFLMTGVSTDYTEILVLRETTKSWKIALFLPLITVPQVIFIAWLINIQAT